MLIEISFGIFYSLTFQFCFFTSGNRFDGI